MTEPLSFTSASPRFALPLLFAGQAQKEFAINEAHALIDALLHCSIEGTADSPPLSPDEGECWLVASAATGAWAGMDGAIACRQAGTWLFTQPRDGMRIFNRSTGQDMRFASGWHAATAPAVPSSGAVIDAEARAAIGSLIAALQAAGILP